jgi:hypothetical protein
VIFTLPLWFLACHMVGDYIFQTDDMAAKKMSCPQVRTKHVIWYLVPFAMTAPRFIFLLHGHGLDAWYRYLMFLFTLGLMHWITDMRRWASGEKWCAKPIMVDQTLHVLQISLCTSWFIC